MTISNWVDDLAWRRFGGGGLGPRLNTLAAAGGFVRQGQSRGKQALWR